MGRIFEKRKTTMFARWNRVSKQFSRLAKDIAIAVKSGGPSPDANPQLRRIMQNARALNMPKDKVEAAIRRASGQDAVAYEEIVYEGYAPHGVAILVEAATDNGTRTVANVRSIFKSKGGNLGNAGSVAFQFQRMAVFRLKAEGLDADELELELIDHGLEEMLEGEAEDGTRQLVIRTAFTDLGPMQRALEERGIEPMSSGTEYICQAPLELPEDQASEVLELVDALEQDDDVQRVFHALA
ncbi:MAG: YebC/PmpR family DNA-binding transcriptional regulator [Planctomycetota bacterium]